MTNLEAVDTRVALVAQHAHPKAADIEKMFHVFYPGEYLAVLPNGTYQLLHDRKTDDKQHEETIFTQEKLAESSLVIGFAEGLKMDIVVKSLSNRVFRNSRHTTLFVPSLRLEILRGFWLPELIDQEEVYERRINAIPQTNIIEFNR